MKVHGKKGKNLIIEVTEYEMEAITTALSEWSAIELECVEPDRSFGKVLNRVHKQVSWFESLPIIRDFKKLEIE